MTSTNSAPSSADLDAARLLLDRLGISPADLMGRAERRAPAPTFAAYVPVMRAAVSDGTRRVYATYWNRIIEHWGSRRLDEPTPSEINQLAAHLRTTVVTRRNARGGRGAAEHFIAALRCLYRHAENDGLITTADNPARKVAKPRRLPSTRRAVPDTRLAEINHIAATTGNDPALDALLLRLHTETACRRGGALALRPVDLDPDQCLIRLREKGETVRWQPVSPTLMTYLQQHAKHRGAPADGAFCATSTGGRSPHAATITCGCASAAISRGWPPSRSAPIGYGTRPLRGWSATSAMQSPAPTPDTPITRTQVPPPPTSALTSSKSPPPWRASPVKPTR
jgi:integrase/recombinase XerC